MYFLGGSSSGMIEGRHKDPRPPAPHPSHCQRPPPGGALLQPTATILLSLEFVADGIRIHSWYTPWVWIHALYLLTIAGSCRVFHCLENIPCFACSSFPPPASDGHWSFFGLYCFPSPQMSCAWYRMPCCFREFLMVWQLISFYHQIIFCCWTPCLFILPWREGTLLFPVLQGCWWQSSAKVDGSPLSSSTPAFWSLLAQATIKTWINAVLSTVTWFMPVLHK